MRGVRVQAAEAISKPEQRVVTRPILKWAGGKTKLLPHLLALAPEKIHAYLEPMCGGAAIFWALANERRFAYAQLNDTNAELVNLYRVVQSPQGCEDLIARLRPMRSTKREFLTARALDPQDLDPVRRAARVIYLNKTCFNGLYRVNKAGNFNVPFGDYANPNICDEANLRAAHSVLARFDSSDGGTTVAAECVSVFDNHLLRTVGKEDFVYFDPPYVPLSETSNFTAFGSDGFTMAHQAKLAIIFRQLAERGVPVALSNSDTPEVRALYAGLDIISVQVPRAINSKGTARGKVGEVIVAANCRLNNRLFNAGKK